MSLERIIRPFQTGDVFTARVVMPVPGPDGVNAPSSDVAEISWDGENPGVFTQLAGPRFIGVTTDMKEDKDQREIESVRVENPDDPDSYIMVDRLKATSFVNEGTGQRYNLKFADWDKDRS